MLFGCCKVRSIPLESESFLISVEKCCRIYNNNLKWDEVIKGNLSFFPSPCRNYIRLGLVGSARTSPPSTLYWYLKALSSSGLSLRPIKDYIIKIWRKSSRVRCQVTSREEWRLLVSFTMSFLYLDMPLVPAYYNVCKKVA